LPRFATGMVNDDGKVTSLIDRLTARTEEEQAFFTHMDRLIAAIPIFAYAIAAMRRDVPGITTAEIIRSLETAAEELRDGKELHDNSV
jgi:hypothetical protein